MPLIQILIGAALLLFGRQLFWLFVAGVGFVVAAQWATDSFHGQTSALILPVALGVGVLGALASIFFQRVIVGIAGFFAGGYLLSMLLLSTPSLGMKLEGYGSVAYVVGGVVGAILTMLLLDWALIFLSALTGATVITQNATFDKDKTTWLFVALVILGIIVQAGQLGGKARPRRKGDLE